MNIISHNFIGKVQGSNTTERRMLNYALFALIAILAISESYVHAAKSENNIEVAVKMELNFVGNFQLIAPTILSEIIGRTATFKFQKNSPGICVFVVHDLNSNENIDRILSDIENDYRFDSAKISQFKIEETDKNHGVLVSFNQGLSQETLPWQYRDLVQKTVGQQFKVDFIGGGTYTCGLGYAIRGPHGSKFFDSLIQKLESNPMINKARLLTIEDQLNFAQ